MKRLIIIFLIFGHFFNSWAQQKSNDQEYLRTRIFDYAFMLTNEQEDSLINQIRNLEHVVGSQIGIWTQASLNGLTIEEISLKTANSLGLGRKTKNDGILIFVSQDDKRVRIEVGYGLENIIKDEIAGRILREDVAPHFLLKQYGLGLYKAIERMSLLIIDNKELVGQKPEYLQRWDSLSKVNKN